MPSKTTNPARGEAAGLGNVHRLAADDTSINNPPFLNSQRNYRPPTVSVAEIYDGLRRIGIVERLQQEGFRATDADGHRLGDFARDRDAMQVITQASLPPQKRGRP